MGRWLKQSTPYLRPSAARSALMGRVRQRGTAAELAVRRELRKAHIGFRTNAKHLPGRPDVYVPAKKIAIFVHGCFWHRHRNCVASTSPKTNVEYWRAKFADNLERDREKSRALRELGYRVFVVWECETRRSESLARALAKVKVSLRG
jgi:DNA mismatch endonuclease, patch repair protein